jgi:DNA-binding NarL/FixJ family response regulator
MQIAIKLHMSERTVEAHVTNMLSKLGLNSRIQVSRRMADMTAGPRVT